MLDSSYDNMLPDGSFVAEDGWLSLRNKQPEEDGWEEIEVFTHTHASISSQEKSRQEESVQYAPALPGVDNRNDHEASANDVGAPDEHTNAACEAASSLTGRSVADKSAATLEMLKRREAVEIARAREAVRRELITVLAGRPHCEKARKQFDASAGTI
ncbi:hypothetical protein HDU87_006476 [Geranomyces variabilis]|uniref:Uncharacterized protein n=1 Tax=Geranomyces variabilis TaxID=109894 RepID=A0AAD5THV5_9FUNG|nr:hypothetical protein HDU87_006476 [Geranomyces variabilis]